MSDRLTAEDMLSFAGIAAAQRDMDPQMVHATRLAAGELCDTLRRQLGVDVEDVVLGRVLLHIASYVGSLADTPAEYALTDTFLVAAFDLTALERGEMPPA